MPDEVGSEHTDISAQLLELLEKMSLKVGARLMQTLEGDANAYFIAVDPATGATGLYYHDQPQIDAVGGESAQAPEGSRELVVTDDKVVPGMIAALQRIYDATMSRQTKQILTVLAVHHVVTLASWPDPRPARLVLDLLSSRGAKLYRDIMRGMVAAAVAWLRAGEMSPDGVKKWLDDLLRTNQQPFIPGFSSSDAVNWFYAYDEELRDEKGKHGAAPTAFKLHRPDLSGSVTEDQAKKQAFEILRSARQLTPAPLVKRRPQRVASKRVHRSPAA
jgi:hypothetical protein